MKPVYVKILSISILLFTLLSFSNSISSNQTFQSIKGQNSLRQHILVLSDSDSNSTVSYLYKDRTTIDNSNLSINYVDIENNAKMTSLLINQSIKQKFDEIWIISEKLEAPIVSDVLEHLLSIDIPILVWSSTLDLLNNSIKTQLGLTNCNNQRNEFQDSLMSINYTQETNLSSLFFNQPLPTIESLNGSIKIADCQLQAQNYQILSLTKVNNDLINIPIVFQPHYKSKILISSFKFENSVNIEREISILECVYW